MYPLKKSTAITIPIFVHDVSGDAVTGLVDGDFTKRISKNGGAFGAMTVTITEKEGGWYDLPVGTGHSDTNGVLTMYFTASGAKQANLQFRVNAQIFDDLHTLGAGAITRTYTVISSVPPNNPIADVDVWVTSDIGGTNVLASSRTNASGVVTFFLDAGTVYVWKQKSGQNDDQGPDIEVVS